jgi:hypothetical protein
MMSIRENMDAEFDLDIEARSARQIIVQQRRHDVLVLMRLLVAPGKPPIVRI